MRIDDALRCGARARVPYYSDPNRMKNHLVGKFIVAYRANDGTILFNVHWADSMKFQRELLPGEIDKVQGRSDWEVLR